MYNYYVHKICEKKFGGCKKSFSWLGQKVNKKIDTFGHDADNSGSDLCPWPWDDTAMQVPTRHLNSAQYSNRIRSH